MDMTDVDKSGLRILLDVCYHTVKRNPGITENQLAYLVASTYEVSEDQVKTAIRNLTLATNPFGFVPNCVQYFTVPKHKTTKQERIRHLRVRKEYLQQMEEFFAAQREELQYPKVPDLVFMRKPRTEDQDSGLNQVQAP